MACYCMDFSTLKTAGFVYDCRFFSLIVLVMLVVFYCRFSVSRYHVVLLDGMLTGQAIIQITLFT